MHVLSMSNFTPTLHICTCIFIIYKTEQINIISSHGSRVFFVVDFKQDWGLIPIQQCIQSISSFSPVPGSSFAEHYIQLLEKNSRPDCL